DPGSELGPDTAAGLPVEPELSVGSPPVKSGPFVGPEPSVVCVCPIAVASPAGGGDGVDVVRS
ncbi:hypothetical protein U6P78_12565, partial [Cutibacterium acnes]